MKTTNENNERSRPLKTELESGYLVVLRGNPAFAGNCYCTVVRMNGGMYLLTPIGMVSMKDYNQSLKYSPTDGTARNGTLDVIAVYGRQKPDVKSYEFSTIGRTLIWRESV